MARKKIVFVIVEGNTDRTALGAILSNVYDNDQIHVVVVNGDITTSIGVTQSNIRAKIGNMINNQIKKIHVRKSDIKQIIHLVDMDGAYISNTKVISDMNCQKVLYESDGIHTNNVQAIIKRNIQKQSNLNILIGTKNICNIPYTVYYMSCNLDHVLHNKRNNSQTEKSKDAHNFAMKYKDNSSLFLDFICNSNFSVVSNYNDSWDFIKDDMNSIERYTNLGICFSDEIN